MNGARGRGLTGRVVGGTVALSVLERAAAAAPAADRGAFQMQAALFPGVVVAVAAALVLYRAVERRRAARLKISGGRKSLALNLDRSRY